MSFGMSFTTVHHLGNADGALSKDVIASLQNDAAAAASEARLRVFFPQEKERFRIADDYRDWKRTKQSLPLALAGAADAVFMPHAICTTSSLHRFFHAAPPHFFQLNQLAIDVLSPLVTAGDTSSHFNTSKDLTAFFERLAQPSPSSDATPPRIRVRGHLCGDAAVLAEFGGRLSNVVISFEAVVRANSVDPASFILDLSKDARADKQDEQLSVQMYSSPLHRPQSLQSWWTEAEEKKLRETHPDEDWQKRGKRVEMRWAAIAAAEMAELTREYDTLIQRCDAHDAALQQRWMDHATSNSPGVKTVAFEVADDSITVSAEYVLDFAERSAALPLIGEFGNSRHYKEQANITFEVNSKTELHSPSCPLIPLLKQHHFIHQRSNAVVFFLQRFGDEGSLVPHALTVSWQLASSFSEISSRVPVLIKGQLEALPALVFHNPICFSETSTRDLQVNQSSATLELTLQFTWPKSSAPDELWEWREFAEPYQPDLSTLKNEDGRVERWIVRSGPFANRQSFRRRRVDTAAGETLFEEEVAVSFRCKTRSPEHWIEFGVPVPAVLVPAIFDKLKAHDEDEAKRTEKIEKSADAASGAESAPAELQRGKGILSLLNQHFPGVVFGDKSAVQSRIRLNAFPSTTLRTAVHGEIKFGTLKGQLQWGGFGDHGIAIDWRMRADEEQQQRAGEGRDDDEEEEAAATVKELPAILTLHELLSCCNMSRLLSSVPVILLDELRLRDVSMRVENPEFASPTLYVYARTGDDKFDRLLLICGDVTMDSQKQDVARNTVVLRIINTQIINPRRFPGLARIGQGKMAHSFVYAEADSPLRNSRSLKYRMEHCQYAGDVPQACLFPENSVIEHGAHILTIKQQSKLVWTNIEDALTAPLPSSAVEHTRATVTAEMSTSPLTRSTIPFPIPTVMMTDRRCSLALVQYLMTWLDNNSILFGLRYVNKLMRASSVLMDGGLWKKRLAAEFGPRVTRWDDATLCYWRDEWLQRKTATQKYRQVARKVVSADDQKTLQTWPIWFAAAIQLQTRLNTFAAEIMRAPIPQFANATNNGSTDQEDECDDEDEDPDVVALASASLQRPHYGIPSSLQFVVLTSPPFHYSNAYLMRYYELWVRRQQQSIEYYGPRALAHRDLRWFAYQDNEEHTHYLALWLGTVFVESDNNTRNLGVAAEAQDDDDDEVEEEEEEEDTVERDSAPSTARELYLPSVEQCPVLEWEPHNSSLWMAAEHSHAFCRKRGVFSYAHKLDEVWDERAKAISEPRTEPLVDEGDLQQLRVDDEQDDGERDDDEEMNNEDGVKQISSKSHFFQPEPQLPFRVRFIKPMMSALINELEDSINDAEH